MLIAIALALGLLMAFGLVRQVQTIVKRKRSFSSYLYKYISIFSFVALFYQNQDEWKALGIAYTAGIVIGTAIAIVAKQRTMR